MLATQNNNEIIIPNTSSPLKTIKWLTKQNEKQKRFFKHYDLLLIVRKKRRYNNIFSPNLYYISFHSAATCTQHSFKKKKHSCKGEKYKSVTHYHSMFKISCFTFEFEFIELLNVSSICHIGCLRSWWRQGGILINSVLKYQLVPVNS